MLHIGLSECKIQKSVTNKVRISENISQFFFCSYSQVVDIEGVLIDVGCVCTHSYTSGGCQIATVSTHSLHHKHSSLSPSGRLLDLVTALMRK